MKNKIIILVLNNFKNDSRVLKVAKTLSDNSYDVTVVALHADPLLEYEKLHGFVIHRVRLVSRKWSKLSLVQLIKYLEYCFSVIKNYRNNPIFYCNDLQTLPIGAITKLFFNKNIKIIYDTHEYATETGNLKGIRKLFIKILEKLLIRVPDRVITVADSIADEYVRLYGIQKPDVLLNTPNMQIIEKKNIFREIFNLRNDQIIFIYQGMLGASRGVEVILKTFEKLDKDLVVVFMGNGPCEDIIKEYAQKNTNILLHSTVNSNILIDYTSSADFGILFNVNNCLNNYYCSPNKVFEYIMAEIPIIVSNLYEMKKLVENYKIGIVADEYSIKGLSEAIQKAILLNKDEMRENLRKAKINFNWENQEGILIKALNECL